MSTSHYKRTIRILLTAIQSPIAFGRVEALKNYRDYNFYIIGADAFHGVFKLPLIDEYIHIPYGKDPQYLAMMRKIVIKKKIDVIIPATDSEVEVFARYKHEFEKLGIGVVCSSHNTTKICLDKFLMLTFLRQCGIETPSFTSPSSLDDFKTDAYRLGYPRKTLVWKPAVGGSGNRGVWRIQKSYEKELLNNVSIPVISLDELLKQLKKLHAIPRSLLMEYLPGEEFSTDCLAEKGEPIYIVPRVRTTPLPGYSQRALLIKNDEVSSYITRMCRALQFDSVFNVQLKYSKNGRPLVYEINPRISATVVANAAAGIDIFLYSILQSINIPFRRNCILRQCEMIRFFKEFYAYDA